MKINAIEFYGRFNLIRKNPDKKIESDFLLLELFQVTLSCSYCKNRHLGFSCRIYFKLQHISNIKEGV